MSVLIKPEGQTTSDNFVVSEMEKGSLLPQSCWGELSESDLNYLSKKGFKTPAELLKSYRELEKAFSSKVALPKDGDKEAWDKLYSRLGMPDNTVGFDIDFLDVDLEDGEKFKEVCLNNNILPKSAKALYEWYVKNRSEALAKFEDERFNNSMRELEEMKEYWGASMHRNIELLRRGLRLFVGNDEELIDDIERSVGTKRMIEAFCRLGEAISEDNPVSFGANAKNKDDGTLLEYFREVFNDY